MVGHERQEVERAARTERLARRALADLCEEEGDQLSANRHRALARAMDNSDVVVATTLGDFFIKMAPERARGAVANFLRFVEQAYYDGTIFHRVIPGFWVEGGGYLPGLREKAPVGPALSDEGPNWLSNTRGTVGFVADPGSGCQFLINLGDNSDGLDGPGQQVFGSVSGGMDVVDRMAGVPTAYRRGLEDVPVNEILIYFIRRLR